MWQKPYINGFGKKSGKQKGKRGGKNGKTKLMVFFDGKCDYHGDGCQAWYQCGFEEADILSLADEDCGYAIMKMWIYKVCHHLKDKIKIRCSGIARREKVEKRLKGEELQLPSEAANEELELVTERTSS